MALVSSQKRQVRTELDASWKRILRSARTHGWRLAWGPSQGRRVHAEFFLEDGHGNGIKIFEPRQRRGLVMLGTWVFYEATRLSARLLRRVMQTGWHYGVSVCALRSAGRIGWNFNLGIAWPKRALSVEWFEYLTGCLSSAACALEELFPLRSRRYCAAQAHAEACFLADRFDRGRRILSFRSLGIPDVPRQMQSADLPEWKHWLIEPVLLRESSSFFLYSCVGKGGRRVLVLTSRVPRHRHFAWVLPEDSPAAADFEKLRLALVRRHVQSFSSRVARSLPLGRAAAFVLGEWDSRWQLQQIEIRDEKGRLLDPAMSFGLYYFDSPRGRLWVLENRSFLRTLWLLEGEQFSQLVEFFNNWP